MNESSEENGVEPTDTAQEAQDSETPEIDYEPIEEASERMAAERDEMHVANQNLAAEFESLQQQIAQLQEAALTSNSQLSQQIEFLQESNAAQLATIEHLQTTNAELGHRVQQMEESVAADDHWKTVAAEFQAKAEHHENELTTLQASSQQQIESLSLASSQSQSQLSVAQQEIERLTVRAEELESALMKSQTEIGGLIHESQAVVQDLSLQNQGSANDLAGANREIERLSTQVFDLQAVIAGNKGLADALETQRLVSDLRSEIDDLERELAEHRDAKRKMAELSSALDELTLENQRLTESFESQSQESEQMLLFGNRQSGYITGSEVGQLRGEIESLNRQLVEQNESYMLVQYWLEQERETTTELRDQIAKQRLDAVQATPGKRSSSSSDRSSANLNTTTKRAVKRNKPNTSSKNASVAKRSKPTKKTKASVTKKVSAAAAKAAKKPAAKPTTKKEKPIAAAKLAKKPKVSADDLCRIEGIGPKIKRALAASSIVSFRDLSKTKIGTLRSILEGAGPTLKGRDASTWAKQAKLAADGKWDKLATLQEKLMGGREG